MSNESIKEARTQEKCSFRKYTLNVIMKLINMTETYYLSDIECVKRQSIL